MSGVQRSDGHDEAEAVSGGDFAATPVASELECRLIVDQPSIRLRQRLGPEVVLVDPTQPAARQPGHILAHQRLQANVAGLCQQHRTDANRQIFDSCGALAEMRELAREAGPGIHFQEQLGQINARQERIDKTAQLDQACGLVYLVEAGHDQSILATSTLDARSGGRRHAGCVR